MSFWWNIDLVCHLADLAGDQPVALCRLYPQSGGAIVILLVGWGIGKLIQALVTRGLLALHFKQYHRARRHQRCAAACRYQAWPLGYPGDRRLLVRLPVPSRRRVNALGITALSTLMSSVILYLPRIFAALLIVIVGSLAGECAGGSHARIGAFRAASTTRRRWAPWSCRRPVLHLRHGAGFPRRLLPFLTTAFAILLGGVTLAAALAFGLGGRQLSADVLAGRELRSIFRLGDHLKYGTTRRDGSRICARR